ncbi:MAG: helix-turn-helix domain-containing protein [Streptosporangiaceae bacterium]
MTGWSSLTETEQAVAGLVAEGLNNGQVAARMYISTHTVAHHLRQAFRKLGIASRVELTASSSSRRRAARELGPRPDTRGTLARPGRHRRHPLRDALDQAGHHVARRAGRHAAWPGAA